MGKGRSRIRWLDNARDKIRVADAAVEFCGGVDTREASASGQAWHEKDKLHSFPFSNSIMTDGRTDSDGGTGGPEL